MKKNLLTLGLGCSLATLLLFTSVTAQTLRSQGQPVTSSSTESSSYLDDYAVDGNTTTKWSSTSSGFNQWLYVDLGATYDISRVAITWADGRYATTFDVMASTDALTWTTLKTYTDYTSGASADIVGLYGNYRYVKFNGRGRANPAGYRIAEFKVYGSTPITPAQQTEINTLTVRLKAIYAAMDPGDMRPFIDAINATDGYFTDLISQSPYNFNLHTSRVKRIAEAYSYSGNVSYHVSAVLTKLQKAMGYIVRNDHHPLNLNFFDTVVTRPFNMMVACVLMKSVISKDSLLYYSSYILDNTGNPASQAKNRTWAAQPPIFKGCIEDRYAFTDRGYTAMATPLDIVTAVGAEGIMNDNSIHQHHDQLYTGGYGQSMLDDIILYQRLAGSLSFASYFTTARQNVLKSSLLSGVQLISYKNNVDFGSAGRDISRVDALTAFKPATLDTMKLLDPGNASKYDAWKANINGTGNFPSTALGASFFWKSANVTYHGLSYYLSAKIITSRTYGTERLNNENLKGYNLPMGATNIMVNGNEYHNIFAAWNWSKIPGTTAELNDAMTLIPSLPADSQYVRAPNISFGGGVANGSDGVIAYEHSARGVRANKAYFFMNDMMVCLGSGIVASKTNEIATTINQSLLDGTAVTINTNGGTSTMSADSLTFDATTIINWVNHNNVGYLFPAGGNASLTQKTRTGNWHYISNDGKDSTFNVNMFTLWFKHSATPSNRTYYYIVAPNKTAADMPAAASGHGFFNELNTTSIQAIRNGSQNKYAVIFHAAGTVTMGDGLAITSNAKAIVMIKIVSGVYQISVSDPIYSQTSIMLTLNKKLSGTGAVISGANTNITFSLPTGDFKGSTLTQNYTVVAGLMAVSNQSALLNNNDTQDNTILVYPNPATNVINVKGLAASADIDVYDLSGHKYKTVHTTAVDVSELKAGTTYFLRIHVDGKVISKQFIKQ